MSDKQSATKSLENIHANLVESIKLSNVMKNSFYPQMKKAILALLYSSLIGTQAIQLNTFT